MLALALAVILGLPGVGRLIPVPLSELVRKAELIAVVVPGERSVTAAPDERTARSAEVELELLEVLKGTPVEPLRARYAPDVTVSASYPAEETLLVFLRPIGDEAVYGSVRLRDGVVRVSSAEHPLVDRVREAVELQASSGFHVSAAYVEWVVKLLEEPRTLFEGGGELDEELLRELLAEEGFAAHPQPLGERLDDAQRARLVAGVARDPHLLSGEVTVLESVVVGASEELELEIEDLVVGWTHDLVNEHALSVQRAMELLAEMWDDERVRELARGYASGIGFTAEQARRLEAFLRIASARREAREQPRQARSSSGE